MSELSAGITIGLIAMYFLKEIIVSLFVAVGCASRGTVPFKTALNRGLHEMFSHPYDKSKLCEKLRSASHPSNDEDYIYTVNIMKCGVCGLSFNDCGMEPRRETR